jgi:hypothetical protein
MGRTVYQKLSIGQSDLLWTDKPDAPSKTKLPDGCANLNQPLGTLKSLLPVVVTVSLLETVSTTAPLNTAELLILSAAAATVNFYQECGQIFPLLKDPFLAVSQRSFLRKSKFHAETLAVIFQTDARKF